ncbi:MAG: sodium-dependent transporter [Lachnospiraceae bacterium]|nr:sodium-dependent transporter [Lachnospiraceae bacterium]
MQREKLGSRLGFILLSAGCAIGIGNVWKFPYMVGQYGGGAFVLIYVLFLAILGVPVLTMEFAMGRAGQKSPVMIYRQLEKKGSKWHLHGYVALIGNYLLLMFYTSVAGWLMQYFVKTAGGAFAGRDTAGIRQIYEEMLTKPGTMLIYVAVSVLIALLVCSAGLEQGLERITKWMMTALLGIMVVLAVNSVFMEGSAAGLKFYLLPDFDRMAEVGLGNIIVGAMNQAFFTLSIGMGSMAIFGSYIGKERTLLGEAVNVAALDTFVAFASGLIIFPACLAYGVQVDSGKSLIFITLPNIFNHIPLGRVWGSLFFVFMSFAALTTVLGVFENLVSCTMDLFGWGRKKACVLNGIALSVLSVPCVLGFNLWSGFEPLGQGSNVMDLEDFLVSNLLLPLGSLVFVLFCTTRYGWGWDNFVREANEGKGLCVAKWMRGYMTFVLPVILFVIFLVGILG